MLQQLGFMAFIAVFSVLAFVPPREGQAMRLKEIGSLVPRSISFHDVGSVVPLVTESITQERLRDTAGSTFQSAIAHSTDALLSSESSGDVWRGIANVSDDETRHQFLMIEWARVDGDRASCSSMHAVSGASQGDWIAYCFARVTRNPNRCHQITDDTKPALRALCTQEFTSHRTTRSFLATLLPW